MKIGDRVRVSRSVVVYHHPQYKKEAFDLIGMEGEIIKIMNVWDGKPISPNLPIVAKFLNNFKAHFCHDELEVMAASED